MDPPASSMVLLLTMHVRVAESLGNGTPDINFQTPAVHHGFKSSLLASAAVGK